MATNNPKPKRKPAHLPPLPEVQRRAIVDQLNSTALHPQAKRQIIAMLNAAANPDAEAPDVVIQSLEPERRNNILETVNVLSRFTGNLTARGTALLVDMPEAEFNAVVDEANDE